MPSRGWPGVLARCARRRRVTAFPRWTLDPVPGVGRARGGGSRGPGGGATPAGRCRRRAASAVLLAAHATVLAALSGEREVATGYVAAEGASPLPCRLTAEPGTWRALLQARPGRVEIAAAQGLPGRRPEARAGPGRAVVRDRSRPARRRRRPRRTACCGWVAARAAAGAAAAVPDRRARRGLRRQDRRLSPGRARLIAADPDAEHDGQSLLSAEELRFQLDGLAGPRRELPDRRFHELFEQHVRQHPDAVAAVHGDRQWTYRELNARANRLAGPCWRTGCAARASSRSSPSATWTGWPRSSRSSRPAASTCRSSRTSRPTGSRPRWPGPGARLVLTEPGSTATLDEALASVPEVADAARRRRLRGGPRRREPRRPRRAGPARLHLLHLRLHRRAQGRDVRARGPAQPPLRQDRRPARSAGGGGRPDRAAVLRHLAVAAGVGAAGRRADPAGRAGGDPGRERFVDTVAAGRATCCRSCRRTSTSCCPTWSSTPASCRTCGACRSPVRR